MKKSILFLLALVSMLFVFSVSVGAATEYPTPADAVAGLTGRTVESVLEERRTTGKSLGTIAQEAGVLDEFKEACNAITEERLSAMVAEGRMTQKEADDALQAIKERRELCNGDGTNSGAGCGAFAGTGAGRGINGAGGMGGRGNGNGRGMGNCGRFVADAQ